MPSRPISRPRSKAIPIPVSGAQTVKKMLEDGVLKAVDADAAAHMLNSAAMNAAIWIAASNQPERALPNIIDVFTQLASGLRQSS